MAIISYDAIPPQPKTPAGSALEYLAKIAAVTAAVSALLGMTYNVAFFMGDKQDWLFHLSVADNFAATMYALPFVVSMALIGSLVIIADKILDLYVRILLIKAPHRKIPIRIFQWAILYSLIPIVGYLWYSFRLYAAPTVLSQSIIVGIAAGYTSGWMTRFHKEPWLQPFPSQVRISIVFAFVLIPLMLQTAWFARMVRNGSFRGDKTVEIEVAHNRLYSGHLVRTLDGGIILANNDDWLWIPRSEIKVIKESHAP